MDLEIKWLAVLLAVVTGMFLAGVWYTDKTFGPLWRDLTGIRKEDSVKSGNTPILKALAANVVTAIVLAASIDIVTKFFSGSALWLALAAAFSLWLAFSATTLYTHNVFEQKGNKLTLINNGYQLVLFLSMGLVIGMFY